MRRIESQVSKERFFGIQLLLGPTQCSGEEHVGAETLRLHDRVVVQDHAIEVLVRSVWRKVCTATLIRLADATRTVNKGLAEAAVVRLIRVLVSQMPLTENAGRVSVLVE